MLRQIKKKLPNPNDREKIDWKKKRETENRASDSCVKITKHLTVISSEEEKEEGGAEKNIQRNNG